jgi:hypothetical protein
VVHRRDVGGVQSAHGLCSASAAAWRTERARGARVYLGVSATPPVATTSVGMSLSVRERLEGFRSLLSPQSRIHPSLHAVTPTAPSAFDTDLGRPAPPRLASPRLASPPLPGKARHPRRPVPGGGWEVAAGLAVAAISRFPACGRSGTDATPSVGILADRAWVTVSLLLVLSLSGGPGDEPSPPDLATLPLEGKPGGPWPPGTWRRVGGGDVCVERMASPVFTLAASASRAAPARAPTEPHPRNCLLRALRTSTVPPTPPVRRPRRSSRSPTPPR